MKKNLLISFVILLSGFKISAQIFNSTKIGLEEAFNYFELNGNRDITKEHQASYGYYIGLSLHFKINHNTSFISGLNFVKSNTKSDTFYIDPVSQQSILVESKNTFHYINIPFIFQYEFENHCFINGGLFINNLTRFQTGRSRSNYLTHTIDKGRVDFGLSIGIGYTLIHTRYTNIYVALRDNMGLKHTGNLDYNTNTINLITGWKISI